MYPNLVHLPTADQSSADLLVQQFIKNMSDKYYDSDDIILSTIERWDADEHGPMKLITINELNDQKNAVAVDDLLLSCDGCAKPIQIDCHEFYCCVPCKQFLHKICAELSRVVRPNIWQYTQFAQECSEPYNLFFCIICGGMGNGIFFTEGSCVRMHIRCAALPYSIKHETHPHQLQQIEKIFPPQCRACGDTYLPFVHGCGHCDFHICDGCIMNPSTVNHRWDSHPLHLIYEAGMVTTDHEHEFNCEYCSNDIDTNWWFYHCSVCDLSLHLKCFNKFCNRRYSDVKFGADNIFSDKLHPHN